MKQIRSTDIENVVFLDIETARKEKELKIDTPEYDAWKYKMARALNDQGFISEDKTELEEFEAVVANYNDKAALAPEFSRIVCITVGRVVKGVAKLTTYDDDDEEMMLKKFNSDLNRVVGSRPKVVLCGHSIVAFDIPFIFKRCLANRVIPADLIDCGGLKPWEVTALDTKILWKGTGYLNSSLVAVCLAMGVESPKSDITGAQVGEVYYGEGAKGLVRIVKYCERDVFALINIFLAWRFEDQLEDFEVNKPKEVKELGLIQRIAQLGAINPSDRKELLAKVKGIPYEEKEQTIKLLKASLAINKNELDKELEIEILKA